jgi:kynurenine formamidase
VQPISRVLVAHVTNLTPPGSECKQPCAEVKSHKKGDKANSSDLRFNAHTGTHIDAPRHFVQTDPAGIDAIPLRVINGPALLVEAFGVEALTAQVLASLHIPTTVGLRTSQIHLTRSLKAPGSNP